LFIVVFGLVAGCKGDAGPQGPKGDRGDKGEQGIQGIQGEKGDKGDPGDQGQAGSPAELVASFGAPNTAYEINDPDWEDLYGSTAKIDVTIAGRSRVMITFQDHVRIMGGTTETFGCECAWRLVDGDGNQVGTPSGVAVAKGGEMYVPIHTTWVVTEADAGQKSYKVQFKKLSGGDTRCWAGKYIGDNSFRTLYSLTAMVFPCASEGLCPVP
jgi:hypothetical protein